MGTAHPSMPSRVLEPWTQRGYRGNSMARPKLQVEIWVSKARTGSSLLTLPSVEHGCPSKVFVFLVVMGSNPSCPKLRPPMDCDPTTSLFCYSLSSPMQAKSKGYPGYSL